MTERRKATRQRMVRSGRIIVGRSSIDCAVLDVSEDGAHLFLPASAIDDALVLFHVTLQLPDGRREPARRCWQSGSDIGFQFQSRS